jgi:hypothetical protein
MIMPYKPAVYGLLWLIPIFMPMVIRQRAIIVE